MKKYHHLAGPLLYFSCEVPESEKLPVSSEEVGIDVGVSHLATLSNGEMIEHVRRFGVDRIAS